MPLLEFYIYRDVFGYISSMHPIDPDRHDLLADYYRNIGTVFSVLLYLFFIFGWIRVVLTIKSRTHLHRLNFSPVRRYNWINFILIAIELIATVFLPNTFLFFPFYLFLILLILVGYFNKKLSLLHLSLTYEEESLIKKEVLNLGTQFIQLELQDIAERCSLNRDKIERVLLEMIKNREIYAEYSNETYIVLFNQDINIEEIDSLLKIYEQWESGKIEKKIL